QVLANLLSNAIKFTDRGSVRVDLSATPRADGRVQVQFAVRDTGSGIPADKLPEIFEKFTQADGSISRKYGGTGLGLAITRRLVEMQGGEVRVESEPGKGSTFTVVIACEPAPAAAKTTSAKGAAMAPSSAPTSGARLLLVEDNLVNQKVVLAILRKKGYQIEVANEGREALQKLDHEGPYDLILMDVQMPVLDGLEATRAIRREPKWSGIPIIAMTAHAMNGDRERCLQAGMDAYISKPVQPAHLVATIEKHLGSRAEKAAPPSNQIDRVLTDRLIREESGLLTDMLHLFLQLAPQRIDKIEAAASQADPSAVAEEAKMIGAAADRLASKELGACAKRIE